MLTIIFTILKIIGAIILVLIGIIIAAILTILFAPIHYQLEGSFYGELVLKGKLHWILHAIGVTVQYEPNINNVIIKIFGIPLWNMNKQADKKKAEKSKKRKAKKASQNQKEKKIQTVKEKTINRQSVKQNQIQRKTDKQDVDDVHAESSKDIISQNEQIKTENNKTTINNHEKKVENNNDINELKALQEKEVKSNKRIHFISKLKIFWNEILKLLKKITNMFLNIKYTFYRFYDKIKKAVQNIEYYKQLIQTDETKRAFEKAKKCLGKIIRNIKPRKTVIHIDFGTDDPAQTGDILCIYSMFYPWIGQSVFVNPDFENELLQGDFLIKGHITLYHFACAVWIYIFDKDINYLKDALRRRNSNDR